MTNVFANMVLRFIWSPSDNNVSKKALVWSQGTYYFGLYIPLETKVIAEILKVITNVLSTELSNQNKDTSVITYKNTKSL